MKNLISTGDPSGGGEGFVVRQEFRVADIIVGLRRVACSREEAERYVTGGSPHPSAGVIAITDSGRILQGRKLLAACAAQKVTVVDVLVVPGSPALDALVEVCERLESQLTPLRLVLACKEAHEHYVSVFPETERGKWSREKRSDCVSQLTFPAVAAEALGRSLRWAQESVRIGRGLDPLSVEALTEFEPGAKRGALEKLSRLPSDVQKGVATKVRAGEKLEDALDDLNRTASDEGAKYARELNKLAKVLRRLEGWEAYADHETVAAVLTLMAGESEKCVPALASVFGRVKELADDRDRFVGTPEAEKAVAGEAKVGEEDRVPRAA